MATKYSSFDHDSTVVMKSLLAARPRFVAGMNSNLYPNCGATYTDWHVPNANELVSLFNAGYYEAQMGSCQYWTCFGGDQWLMSRASST